MVEISLLLKNSTKRKFVSLLITFSLLLISGYYTVIGKAVNLEWVWLVVKREKGIIYLVGSIQKHKKHNLKARKELLRSIIPKILIS